MLRIKDLIFQVNTHDHPPAHVHVYSPNAKNLEASVKTDLKSFKVLEFYDFDIVKDYKKDFFGILEVNP